MKLFKVLAIVALAMLSGANVNAGLVVLSNLGAAGTDGTGLANPLNSNLQTGTSRNAMGFKTGASSFSLSAIGAVLGSDIDPTGVSVQFAIYSSEGTGVGNPGTKLYDSGLETVDATKYYEFAFTGAILSAATNYWAVIESGASSRWYTMDFNAGNGIVTERNGSGFTFLGSNVTATFGTGGWGGAGSGATERSGFSVFGTQGGQVPEPALTSLLCLGGVALIRRRMKK